MWSVAEGRCVRILTGHKGAVTSLQVSPCGRLAATAGEDKRIKIWDLAEGKWIKVSARPSVADPWNLGTDPDQDINKIFFAYSFLKVHLHNFQR
jgi:WD40 repeat protein